MQSDNTFTAFAGTKRVAAGDVKTMLLGAKKYLDRHDSAALLIFEDQTGRQIDFDFRGTPDEVIERLPSHPLFIPAEPPARTGPGRPKLGVVGKEVSLLPRHWAIHVHAAVFLGWLALLIGQTVLAASGQIALHRRVGNLGIAYGIAVVILGLVAGFVVPATYVKAGTWPLDRAASFLATIFGDMVLFGGFFGAAIAYRGRPELHKRLMLLAA